MIRTLTSVPLRAATTFRSAPTAPTTLFKQFKIGSSLSTTSAVNMANVKQLVDQGIKDNNVIVYGKSYCPYCQRAKKLIQEETSDFVYIDIDHRDDGSEIQAYLKQLNGQGTVPHVYIGQQFVGGCSELQAIPKAELKARLNK